MEDETKTFSFPFSEKNIFIKYRGESFQQISEQGENKFKINLIIAKTDSRSLLLFHGYRKKNVRLFFGLFQGGRLFITVDIALVYSSRLF
jgi:hypothetical protein